MSIDKAILKIGKIKSGQQDEVEYYDMPVQYNPSSLSFSSRAGLVEEEGPGEAGLSSHMSAYLPPETTLSFDLIFEAVETEDAFLSYKRQQGIEGALGKKRIQSADTRLKSKGNHAECSVQEDVEKLLALVRQVATKQVVFTWGKASFAGELEDIDAEYTMFNAKGHPIYAKVSISIRQAVPSADEQGNKAEDTYWNEAWKKFKQLAPERNNRITKAASLSEHYNKAGELLKLNI